MEDNLPSRQSWPDLVFDLPELQYPPAINIAEQLLTEHHAGPDRTAIIFRNTTISYGSLRRRVLSLSAGLIRAGVKPADRVALRLPNGPDFVASWLALQWIGAICVSLPPLYRRREIEHIVNHSGAVAIICGADLAEHVESARSTFASRVALILVSAEPPVRAPTGDGWSSIDGQADRDSAPPPPPPHVADLGRPASLTYITSAEGPPKGVVHSRADILAATDTYARDVLKLTSMDICIGTMSLAWAFGVGSLLTFPLRVGAATVLLESGSVALLLSTIGASRATILFGAPTTYRMLLLRPDLESFDLSSLRCCVSAAEPLPPAVIDQWRSRTGLEILDGLGTTELTHIFISARPGAVRPGLVGTPVAGYEARVVDDGCREVARGVPGRLAVRGPTGARYWRDQDAQCRTVRGGWTLTGDICVQQSDGWFQHVRRADDLIVSAGHKISSKEIERTLEEHPAVWRAHVFSAPDPVRGQAVTAVVIPAEGVDADGLSERLQRYLKDELATFKCPREIRIVKR